jgi:hypothetical protein
MKEFILELIDAEIRELGSLFIKQPDTYRELLKKAEEYKKQFLKLIEP